jgi:hypothetical protein
MEEFSNLAARTIRLLEEVYLLLIPMKSLLSLRASATNRLIFN